VNKRTAWGAIIPLVTALVYGASPIDLIPDVIPLIGWLDDAIVVPLLLTLAFLQWRMYNKHRRAALQPVRN
jgi:uncharacterized membrane protein YkvA (DUF1232 family)